MAHNFIKAWLLQTLAVTNDFDIICHTETFLGSSIENDDEYPYHDMIFCALAILVTQREEVFVFVSRKRNVSLQASIDPLAKHPMNLRISAQTLTYSCQICQMISIPHVIL